MAPPSKRAAAETASSKSLAPPLAVNSEHVRVTEPQPHMNRRRALRKKLGDDKLEELQKADPFSIVYVFVLVALQFGLAYAVKVYEAPWWAIVAGAYLVGAFADHGLWVLIHDLTHNNVFTRKGADIPTYSGHILANLPLIAPSAISFCYFHREHHGHLNEAYEDPDLPGELENKVFGHSALGKATWLLFFPIVQSIRTIRYSPRWGVLAVWNVLNWIVQMSANIAVVYYWGWPAFAYLGLSSCFAIGLHPLGARWIAEHYSTHPPQETYSYYGGFNKIMFNVGYHNEHHDLPNVPWKRLPELRNAAPELYDEEHAGLAEHSSYWGLLLDFIFKPEFTLHTRVIRTSGEGDKSL